MQMQNNGQVDQAMIQAMRQFKTKIKNAYVLIYDRVETYDQAKFNEVIDDPKTVNLSPKELAKLYQSCKIQAQSQNVLLKQQPQIPHNVHDLILAKNKKFWLNKTIFSQSFIEKMLEIFRGMQITTDNDYHKYTQPNIDLQTYDAQGELEQLRFFVTFFLTVAIRGAEKSILPDFVFHIRKALQRNIGLCLWLIENFTS
mmetsp:Transcript_11515/g.19477  ORF Transcript_11515/g.19477 Transcript_11515/m.19477 type:complete len:199 (-) Transcript_11515:455-1051(-)